MIKIQFELGLSRLKLFQNLIQEKKIFQKRELEKAYIVISEMKSQQNKSTFFCIIEKEQTNQPHFSC